MSACQTTFPETVECAAPAPRLIGFLRNGENLAVSAALAAMMLIPVAEMALRKTLGIGIAGSNALVQHLTLVVGMLGAAIAARQDRMLALSTAELLLRGRVRAAARIFSYSFAAAVGALLGVAGFQFLEAGREAGKILAYGIPVWAVQAVIPLGFAAITLRLIRHASPSWTGRAAAALLAGAIVWIGVQPLVAPAKMVAPALVALLAATVLGAPVFVTMGGAALILFWGAGVPIASISVDHYRLVTNPSLPTVPLFTLAGYFLAEGGASKRLIRVFQALVGQFRGGPAIVTVVVCAFFTSFTGGSGVTILALGGLLMPMLREARYSEKASLGLLTGAPSLGLLFPPCLPLILYAIIANVPIEQMFLGCVIPGTVMLAVMAAWGIRQDRQPASERPVFSVTEARRAIWDAKWELLLPVVALAGLMGGFATPVEAAALAAVYAFVIETFIYRDLRIVRDLPRVMAECGLLIGGVLLILGVALGFTNYLVDAEVPAHAVEWVTGAVHSPIVFLLLLNISLLLVGALMDIFSALLVVVPLIVPLGEAYHIDPIHLGIIFLANLELGYLTPPMGENVFLASYRFGKPIPEVSRSIIPVLMVMLVGVLLITYCPPLTTALPRWLAR